MTILLGKQEEPFCFNQSVFCFFTDEEFCCLQLTEPMSHYGRSFKISDWKYLTKNSSNSSLQKNQLAKKCTSIKKLLETEVRTKIVFVIKSKYTILRTDFSYTKI